MVLLGEWVCILTSTSHLYPAAGTEEGSYVSLRGEALPSRSSAERKEPIAGADVVINVFCYLFDPHSIPSCLWINIKPNRSFIVCQKLGSSKYTEQVYDAGW